MPNIKSHNEVMPAYLSIRQAAKWAGVSPKTITRWIGKGLPSYQAGPRERVLLKPVDIEQFLTCKRVPRLDLDEMVKQTFAELVGKTPP
jgi:predicted site-specific integrase-resolvase